MNDDTTDLDPLDVLVEEFSSKLRTGSAPSVEDFARLHPKEAGELRDLLPAVVAMEEIKRRRQSGQPLIGTKMPDRVGDFQIVREIGRGGMGIVYEAQERTLSRRVALKILPGHGLLSTVRLQRFQREAQTAAHLHHTNIVPVFGVGEADGLHYYVMQFIEGRSLHQIVEQSIQKKNSKADQRISAKTNGPKSNAVTKMNGNGARSPKVEAVAEALDSFDFRLSTGVQYWRWAAHVAVQVADALHYAHTHGVLHRDIKPANILIDAQDTAWITDFGLAKLGDHDSLTRSGDLLGTLQYMAPESFKGASDARADVYSLGLTLYEILTRQPPYSETTAAGLIHEISQREPIHPRKLDAQIPQDLETIILKAAARTPEQRYQSAAELADDLRRFLDDRPIRARKAGSLERAVRWCRRNRTVAALGTVAAAAILMALVAGWVGYSQTSAALKQVAHEAEAARSAENRADANVEMSLQALEEMFEQLNRSNEAAENARPQPPPDKPPAVAGSNEPKQPGTEKSPNAPPSDPSALQSAGPRNAPSDKGPAPNTWPDDRSRRGPGQQGFGRWGTENVGLVQSILTFYERFAEKNATNMKLRQESARAYERVGELQMRLHQNEKAELAFRRALSTIEQLSPQVANSPSLVSIGAKARARLGDLFHERKEFESANSFYTQAIDLLVPIAAGDFRFREDLARTRLNYGESLAKEKNYVAAIEVVKAAISPLEDGSDYPRARYNTSLAYRKLAEIYELNGNHQASQDAAKMADEFKNFRPWGSGPGGR